MTSCEAVILSPCEDFINHSKTSDSESDWRRFICGHLWELQSTDGPLEPVLSGRDRAHRVRPSVHEGRHANDTSPGH